MSASELSPEERATVARFGIHPEDRQTTRDEARAELAAWDEWENPPEWVDAPWRGALLDETDPTRDAPTPDPSALEVQNDAPTAGFHRGPITDDYEVGYQEGFHHGRSTPITDDWEYGHEYTEMDGMPYISVVSEVAFQEHRPDGHRSDGSPYWNYTPKRRRKAGPWEPVPTQEEQQTDGGE